MKEPRQNFDTRIYNAVKFVKKNNVFTIKKAIQELNIDANEVSRVLDLLQSRFNLKINKLKIGRSFYYSFQEQFINKISKINKIKEFFDKQKGNEFFIYISEVEIDAILKIIEKYEAQECVN